MKKPSDKASDQKDVEKEETAKGSDAGKEPVVVPDQSKRRGLILMIVVIICFGTLGWFLYKVPMMQTVSNQGVKTTGTATIGGPFTLVDHFNKTVTDADFRGRYMLIFFGYTYCPDVCPTTLTDISDALGLLGKDAADIAPIFITVDPERDKPEHMKEYVKHFHPKIIGMSGSVEQVKKVAGVYRVFFQKAREKGAEPDDYLMNHSSITYLMGKDGKFLTHFSHGTSAKDLAAKIKSFL
ncbi:MAG: SCO family protein [Rhodospirillaceae bacterium]|jgi:cytochrome oxidase Cu insertion factor (SCO1/SenC/PrrC family)|nr:SCO family protein [Rhodospirillales bacterium]MBT3907756.1 SCO family protein [Rhodospirillaceae bacterium]MBT4700115.1 SCO family protein [Rhodospirillaceae bacterium]MBT5035156.1 SCO family protein [Rhodospirillaceae bacterium]MBT6220179.1 SCO family protein [Rhodospirillaceae bacterium]